MSQPALPAAPAGSIGRIRGLIRLRAGVLLRQISRVRASASADGIHDLRVATRRLQEALEFFGPLLPSRPRRRLFRRARRIRRELGDVRNADVTLELLSDACRRLEGDDAKVLQNLRQRLSAEAAALRRGGAPGRTGMPVPGALKRCRALMASLEGRDSVPPLRRGRALLAIRVREILRRIPPALTGDAVALHRLRIAMKRFRYTLEILESLGWRRAKTGIDAARGLQEDLGRLHDLDVLSALIRREPPAAATRALLRKLAGERRSRLDGIRKTLSDFHPEEILSAMNGPGERSR